MLLGELEQELAGAFDLFPRPGVQKDPRIVAADDDSIVEGAAQLVLQLSGIQAL